MAYDATSIRKMAVSAWYIGSKLTIACHTWDDYWNRVMSFRYTCMICIIIVN